MNTENKTIEQPIEVPKRFNPNGYYYHYKHDPNGSINNYAYRIFGPGHHTEDNARAHEKFMQVYLPLYDTALVYKMGKFFDLRPNDMSVEEVEYNGHVVQRFAQITDPAIIAKLHEFYVSMYPEMFE
jgi:hypothetical protein